MLNEAQTTRLLELPARIETATIEYAAICSEENRLQELWRATIFGPDEARKDAEAMWMDYARANSAPKLAEKQRLEREYDALLAIAKTTSTTTGQPCFALAIANAESALTAALHHQEEARTIEAWSEIGRALQCLQAPWIKERLSGMSNAARIIRLRNGSELQSGLVSVTLLTLRRLMEERPIDFYELVMKCRDPKHELWDDKILKQWSLIEPDGQPHQCTREIVLAAVVGDEMEMRIINPIAEEDR